MAIFRGGKRIGPFDIRLGFPRDRSMQNIDNDPRIRQPANSENTIGRFRAAMASANGYARAARFAVRLFPPVGLAKLVEEQQEAVYSEGSSEEADKANDKANRVPTGKHMNDLTQSLGRQINIHCDSVSMPGKDLQTQTVQYGSAPEQDQVVAHGYGGQINASFYADSFLRERHFFEMWQKMTVNHTTHKAKYYDDYVGKMQIYQLASDNLQDQPSYGIEATDVYPATISAVEYSYGSSNTLVKINIGFNYRRWWNMTDSSITGMDFANSTQVIPDATEQNTGLFGKLPIELQRAGRDIFNQARTQLPIGRLTKGKIFPPFT
tara:strand:- start:370 stop:1335 length:966 start_codon:yes stop_codon:yes gene_type:complete